MSFFSRIFSRKPKALVTPSRNPAPPPSTDVPYMLPKDGQEINRLDMQHYILQKSFQANFLAPIQHPARVLDVGSGTGRWMAEIAQHLPQTSVYGFDLDQPTFPFPKNCSFTQGNLLDGLPFANASFDFVHQRLLILGLPLDRWPSAIEEMLRVTRPGGWIELVECDLHFYPQGPYTQVFVNWLDTASQQRGIDIGIGTKTTSFLHKAGLLHVTEYKRSIPLGNWGGRIGTMLLADFSLAARQTLKPLLVKSLSLNPQEYDFTVERWIEECESYHASCDFYLVDAQKG